MKGEIQLETVQSKKSRSLTEGSITGGLISFAIPLLFGQLLQQCYNMADAWVVGNFASNDAFAAVSMAGHITFTVIGFFNGIAIGGGVGLSRYFGAKDEEQLRDPYKLSSRTDLRSDLNDHRTIYGSNDLRLDENTGFCYGGSS